MSVVKVHDPAVPIWRIMSGGVLSRRVPGPPRAVALSPGGGSLMVTWAAPWDKGNTPITGYTVSVTPADHAPVTVGGSTLSTSITGLTNGRSYTVRVLATNAVGSSPAALAVGSPAGTWVIGSIGAVVGATPGWGGNGGVNNGRGYYGATAPPPGVTNGYQMGPDYCGVLPVLKAQGKTYADLTPVGAVLGPWSTPDGTPTGSVAVDTKYGNKQLIITREGAVLEYLDIAAQVIVRASNVTIRYCRIDCRGMAGTGAYIVNTQDKYPNTDLHYCECISSWAISSTLPPLGSWSARYNEVWNISNDAFKIANNNLVEFNWTHHLYKGPNAHADNTQWVNGDNIGVRFNRFEMYEGAENEISPELKDVANSGLQIGTNMAGNASWLAWEDNYIDGATYLLRAGIASPKVSVKGTFTTEHCWFRRNRFGRKFYFGPLLDTTEDDPAADQHVDNATNLWHESGQTYVWSVTDQKWYYAAVVEANTPVNTWVNTHLGVWP